MTSEFGIRFHQGGGARNNCLTLDFFHKFSSHRRFLEFTATFQFKRNNCFSNWPNFVNRSPLDLFRSFSKLSFFPELQ